MPVATVLVVEDDRNLQILIAEALRAAGFAVVLERDGAEAVARFGKAPADLLLLDVLLPGMNGFQVAERVRALPGGDVPIVMMSGTYRGQKTVEAARSRFGLAGYVEKPFQLEHLVEVLRGALSSPAPTPAPAAPFAPAAPTAAAPTPSAPARAGPAHPQGAARLVMRSKFGERALPWVFAELFRRRATGVLVLTRAQQLTCAYFRDGLVVAARRRGKQQHLAQLLVRDRVLSAAELEHVRMFAHGSALRLPAALTATAHADAELLAAIDARRLDTALVDAFGWADGEARFFLRERVPAWAPRFSPQPPTALLYHFVRSGLSALDLAKELASKLDERPVAAREQAWALFAHLPPKERDFLLSLDGRLSMREVIAQHALDDAPALLLTAMCLGLIMPATVLQAAPANVAPPPTAPHASAKRSTGPVPRVTPPGAPPEPPPPPRRPTGPIVESIARPPPVAPTPVAPAGRPVVVSARPTASVPPASVPRPAAAAPPSPADEAAKLGELRQRVTALESQDHFGVLGLARGATSAEVRTAYHKLAKLCHPDRHAQSGPEIREAADKLFARVSEAYRVLADPALTAKYEEQLKKKPGDVDAAEQLARVVGAEKSFRQGEAEMKRRNYAAAVGHFDEATRLYKDEGEYHAWLGYALALAMPNDFASQRRSSAELALALQLNPRCAKAHLFQGYLFKNQDRMREAELAFRQALELDGKEIDAERELRLLNMRREKTPPKKR